MKKTPSKRKILSAIKQGRWVSLEALKYYKIFDRALSTIEFYEMDADCKYVRKATEDEIASEMCCYSLNDGRTWKVKNMKIDIISE